MNKKLLPIAGSVLIAAFLATVTLFAIIDIRVREIIPVTNTDTTSLSVWGKNFADSNEIHVGRLYKIVDSLSNVMTGTNESSGVLSAADPDKFDSCHISLPENYTLVRNDKGKYNILFMKDSIEKYIHHYPGFDKDQIYYAGENRHFINIMQFKDSCEAKAAHFKIIKEIKEAKIRMEAEMIEFERKREAERFKPIK